MALSEIIKMTNEIPVTLQKSLGIEERYKLGMSEERFNAIKGDLRK